MKKIIIVLAALLAVSASLMADSFFTDTFTPTATATPTSTVTGTPTITSTITPTFTITPTWTPWPIMVTTPTAVQYKVFAYPNPARNRDTIAVTYPIDAAKIAKEVKILIYSIDGDQVCRSIDDGPYIGYTVINISKFARGVYMFKVFIKYTDSTEQALPMRKFSVLK